jgi:hypothetical protein
VKFLVVLSEWNRQIERFSAVDHRRGTAGSLGGIDLHHVDRAVLTQEH